jgi:hypothetical protein
MKPVLQTQFGAGVGNCFAACIASILAMPIEAVPNFCGEPPFNEHWEAQFNALVAERGLASMWVWPDSRLRNGLPVFAIQVPAGTNAIATGQSPRGDFLHSVVAEFREDGCLRLVHDPHPSGEFLNSLVRDLIFFLPARSLLRHAKSLDDFDRARLERIS